MGSSNSKNKNKNKKSFPVKQRENQKKILLKPKLEIETANDPTMEDPNMEMESTIWQPQSDPTESNPSIEESPEIEIPQQKEEIIKRKIKLSFSYQGVKLMSELISSMKRLQISTSNQNSEIHIIDWINQRCLCENVFQQHRNGENSMKSKLFLSNDEEKELKQHLEKINKADQIEAVQKFKEIIKDKICPSIDEIGLIILDVGRRITIEEDDVEMIIEDFLSHQTSTTEKKVKKEIIRILKMIKINKFNIRQMIELIQMASVEIQTTISGQLNLEVDCTDKDEQNYWTDGALMQSRKMAIRYACGPSQGKSWESTNNRPNINLKKSKSDSNQNLSISRSDESNGGGDYFANDKELQHVKSLCILVKRKAKDPNMTIYEIDMSATIQAYDNLLNKLNSNENYSQDPLKLNAINILETARRHGRILSENEMKKVLLPLLVEAMQDTKKFKQTLNSVDPTGKLEEKVMKALNKIGQTA